MSKQEEQQEPEKREKTPDIIDIASTEVGEDATRYGEFVSSYFAWISLPEQKKNAIKMEKMTEEENATSNNEN